MAQTRGLATDLGGAITFRRFTLTYTDLVALGANLTGSITLFTLPQGGKILGVDIKHSVAFAGTSWTGATVSVGRSGGTGVEFASAFNIFQAVADGTNQETVEFKSGGLAAIAVQAFFTSVGGNLNVGTAGSVDINVAFLNVSTPLP